MTNTQKATIRKIAKEVEKLREQAEHVLTELDEYAHENQDTLDGTARGEKIDGEIDELSTVQDTFEALKDELLEIVE